MGRVQSRATEVIKGPREEGRSELLGLQKSVCVARVGGGWERELTE